MKLQTTIAIPTFPQKISYRTPVLFIGSCFASNMGALMQQRKFPATVNPFGAVYNPLSIAQSLRRLQQGELFSEKELLACNGLYTTFFHHSAFSHPDKTTFLQQANEALQQGAETFRKASFVVVSLGTSWVYWHDERCMVVNNCHKLPAMQFERKKLSVEESVEVLAREIALNPQRTWIFTVSPIRHWKDGAHENQLSKAALLLTVEKLQQQFSNVYYFPAYEIMMDELRDYRFYAEDMLHPSEQAINYIWQRFSETVFDEEALQIIPEIEKINAAQQHRALHPETDNYKKFIEKLNRQIQHFKTQYPFIPI